MISTERPFTSCLEIDYYDGPTSGIGITADGSAVYFHMVARDADDVKRLFALIPIDVARAREAWDILWAPHRSNDTALQASVDEWTAAFKTDMSGLMPTVLCESTNLVSEERRCAALSGSEAKRLKQVIEADDWRFIKTDVLLEAYLAGLQ